MATTNLTPREKAAVLLISLGTDYSAKLYRHLSEEEIGQMTLSITTTRRVEPEVKEQIISEFYEMCLAQKFISEGGFDYARDVLEKAAARRIAAQIEPDGRQPQELARTRSFDYSTMNLRGMFELATLGQRLGIDLWHFESTDGRSIRRALDWLIPFALGEKRWPHEQLGGLRPARLASLLRRAAAVYQEPRYERAVRRLAGADASDRMHLLLPEPRRSNQQSAAVRPNGLFGAWRAGGALDHRP